MKSIPDDAWVPILWRPWQLGFDSLAAFDVLVPPELAERFSSAHDELERSQAAYHAVEREVNQFIVDRLKDIW